MKLEEMKVCDVLKLGLFKRNIAHVIEKLESNIIDAQFRYGALKRTPYDSLKEKKLLNSRSITLLYEDVIDKRLKGFSSRERKLIENIGNTAFEMTMKELIKQNNLKNDKETD